jgi:hypothetical protein
MTIEVTCRKAYMPSSFLSSSGHIVWGTLRSQGIVLAPLNCPDPSQAIKTWVEQATKTVGSIRAQLISLLARGARCVLTEQPADCC